MNDNSDVSLAQRVTTLEVKLMDLELAIAKLQGHDVSPCPQHGFGAGSGQQEPNQQDIDPSPSRDPGTRPASTVTLRPHTFGSHISPSQPSPPPAPDFNGISAEQYNELTALLLRERSARKLLEGQLAQLQRDMDQLRDIHRSSDEDRLLMPSSSDHGSFRTNPHQSTDPAAPRLEAGTRQKPGRVGDDGHVDTYRSSAEQIYHQAPVETTQRNQLAGMI